MQALHAQPLEGTIRLEHIHEFAILARYRSFTAAAKALFLSQPTLTAHVNAMENELGAKLIDRSHQQIELTPIGQTFLNHGQKILAEYDAMKKHINEMQRSKSTRVRLSCFIEHHYVKKILNIAERFLQEDNTNILMETRNILSSDPFSDLENSELDLVICLDNFGELPENFLFEELQEDPLFAIIPSTSRFSERESLSAHDLEGHTLFVPGLPDNKWMKDFTDELLSSLGVKARTNELYFESIDSLYTFDFRNGVYIDSQRATESLISRDYKAIPFEENEMRLREVAIFRSDASEAAKIVIAKLKEAIHYLENRDHN